MKGPATYYWDKIAWEKVREDFWRKFLSGEKVTVAQLRLFKGAKVGMHKHHHEQVSFVIEGSIKFVLEDNSEKIVMQGGVFIIPSNIGHAAEALEDSLVLDIFSPPREDWIKGDDSYLRKHD